MAVAEERPWEVALKRFLAAGFRPGQVITHDWLAEAFGIDRPGDHTPYREAKRLNLQYADLMEKLTEALLQDHDICLMSEPGEGYLWVPPREQAERALRQMSSKLTKYARRGLDQATRVDTRGLTQAERQRQRDLATAAATAERLNRGERREIMRRVRGLSVLPPPAIEEIV